MQELKIFSDAIQTLTNTAVTLHGNGHNDKGNEVLDLISVLIAKFKEEQ